MIDIFTSLNNALEGILPLALGASFVWGVLSIVLSPCHLASIPLIVGYISSYKVIDSRKAFKISLFFSLGILISIILIGVITGLLGRLLGDTGIYGIVGNIFVVIIFFAMGLYLMDLIELSFIDKINRPDFKKRGITTVFIMGFVFGISVGPCTFAYMAPMLAVVFKAATDNLLFSILLLLFFAIGHCSIIVLGGTFSGVVEKYLKLDNERKNVFVIIKRFIGLIVFAAGVYILINMINN